MKKTKFMRAALLLLVLTLITSCFVGGTFAKYTTSITGSDSARVAYWGFDQGASTTIDLFDTTYTSDNGDTVKSSSADKKVIAPGTSKTSTFAFGYTNYKTNEITAPEVAYIFTVNPTITGNYNSLDANDSFKWTLAKGDATATEYNTVAELLADIKALSGDNTGTGTKRYEAGNLPEAFTSADEVYHIGWKWAFETAGEKMAEQDATDTAMGNAANLDNVALTITITATQID